MNISLAQWQAIHAKAVAARIALLELDSQLSQTMLAHIQDADVIQLITAVQDRLSDGLHITQSLKLQSEWLGGDSSDANNHGLREPNALSLIGHIPHTIPNSRGVNPCQRDD